MNSSDVEQRAQAPSNEGQNRSEVKTYNRWQLFMLDRLERLASLNKDAENGDLDELQTKMLRRAIFSTLLDCEQLRVGEEARKMISLPEGEAV